ncbi:EamA family transporter [Chloroflexota bacterium]
MHLDYLQLAIIAMILLGVHHFLVKLISRHVIGPNVAFFVQLLIIPVLYSYIYFTDTPFLPEQKIYLGYTFLISVLLGIGILSLYMAIQKGPVSVVIPIYALNTIITAILGILILQETVSVAKVSGIVLAIVAIILLSRR